METTYKCTTHIVHNTRNISLPSISMIAVHKLTPKNCKKKKKTWRKELTNIDKNLTKNAVSYTHDINVAVFIGLTHLRIYNYFIISAEMHYRS